jgi:hypothetical protein
VSDHLTWVKGVTAKIVRLEGDAIELRSTTSAPPGARLEAVLIETGAPVKIKSHGSHKEADGSFTIKGRLIDATRELREKLGALPKS